MARRVKEFPKSVMSTSRSMYPWDQWMDGAIWELVHGKDFTSEVEHFRQSFYREADKREFYRRSRLDADGKTLYIQVSEEPFT